MFVSVATLRKVLQRQTEETSILAVAREVGVAHSVLRRFLLGSSARGMTLTRLRAWYASTGAGPEITPEHARAAVASLVQAMPPEHREEAAQAVVALLVERHRAAGVKVPDWLEGIQIE
jgi:hypothetical protein